MCKSAELKLTPALFEQPVAREDWKGLEHVSQIAREHYGVLVAADESCRNVKDVTRIVNERSADVVNVKLSKMGVLAALEVVQSDLVYLKTPFSLHIFQMNCKLLLINENSHTTRA